MRLLITILIISASINASASEDAFDNNKCIENYSSKPYWVCSFGSRMKMFQSNDLTSSINLNEIELVKGMIGLGPVSGLRGEVTIYDGEAFIATLNAEKQQVRQHHHNVGAIFLALGYARSWKEVVIDSDLKGLKAIESKVEEIAKDLGLNTAGAFPFKITGEVVSATYHVIFKENDLVHTMKLHKESKIKFSVSDATTEIAGIWIEESGVGHLTHPGKRTHMHSIMKTGSGHLDDVILKKGARLYLPDI